MRSVWQPVDPAQLVKCRNALKRLCTSVQELVTFDVLWEEELNTLD